MIPTNAAVPLSMLLPLLVAACSGSTGYMSVSSGSACVEHRSGGPTYVACYRDGEILGAAAAGDPDFPLREWVGTGEPVDHPDLQRWRSQLENLRALSAAADARGVDLVRAAAGFPFDAAVVECYSAWVGGDAGRAAELLDCADDLNVGDDFAQQLAEIAVRDVPGDARVARWVTALTDADSDEAVITLASSAGAGPRTAEQVLGRLDDYSSGHRRAIFDAAVRRVIGDPAVAYLIVEAAGELPTSEQGRALGALLEGDAPAELSRQILRHLGDRPVSERTALFTLAAERCYRDPHSHLAVARALSDLPGAHRLDAARPLVERPEAPPLLVLLLVDSVDSLPSADREELLSAALDGPQGEFPAVRDACADAAQRHLPSPARARVLERLGRNPR